MKEVMNEFYCRECEHEGITEHRIYECPKCGKGNIFNSSFVTCDCGEKVYLDRNTNPCEECGKLHNGFGQELAPPEEWDEADRYGTFGPQNESEDY